jgi:hypothetical protein
MSFDRLKVTNNSREKMRAVLCKCEFDEEKTKIVNRVSAFRPKAYGQ